MTQPYPKSTNTSADISDATILSEVQHDSLAAKQAQPAEAVIEPISEDSNKAPPSSMQDRMKQAAAMAAAGMAQKAVQSAAERMMNPRPQPTWAFATQSSAHLIALGFGSGLMRPAPGTWGTVFGWVTFNYLLASLSVATQGYVILAAFAIGVWACGAAGRALGVIDHGAWVWDEVVAFWLILWLIPQTFAAQAWAFVLFRLFDIVKPAPIRAIDARMKNGFGVMFDDLLAAGYTLLVIAIWTRVFG